MGGLDSLFFALAKTVLSEVSIFAVLLIIVINELISDSQRSMYYGNFAKVKAINK